MIARAAGHARAGAVSLSCLAPDPRDERPVTRTLARTRPATPPRSGRTSPTPRSTATCGRSAGSRRAANFVTGAYPATSPS